jgi:plasmid stabilization system protein ParE
MRIAWTGTALRDLGRLHRFLEPKSPRAAAAIVEKLTAAPDILPMNPRIGAPLTEFNPRDVRRLIVGDYELRYEVTATTIWILRLWHMREDR